MNHPNSNGAVELTPGRGAPARRLAFMNQKGGVGKTTTTVNVAAAIAELGRRVLLVDLDPQAHATIHLGVDPDAEETPGPSAYDVLAGDGAGGSVELSSPQLIEAKPGLRLLRAETDLAAAESELAGADDRYLRLARATDRVREEFDFILYDCPPSLGLLTLNGLAAAREVIVPMQAHFLALQGFGKLLETVGLVSQRLNPKLRVAGVVLCMFDAQTTHAQEVVNDLREFLQGQRSGDSPWRGARLYEPPIRRNIKLAECPSFGQTIFEYAPWAPGAADYRAVAEQIVGEWDHAIARLHAPGDGARSATASASLPTNGGGFDEVPGDLNASPGRTNGVGPHASVISSRDASADSRETAVEPSDASSVPNASSPDSPQSNRPAASSPSVVVTGVGRSSGHPPNSTDAVEGGRR